MGEKSCVVVCVHWIVGSYVLMMMVSDAVVYRLELVMGDRAQRIYTWWESHCDHLKFRDSSWRRIQMGWPLGKLDGKYVIS